MTGQPFVRVDVRPDSPEWEQARRGTLGASEVPAVLGLSPYATPLDVYFAKLGAAREQMNEELAFIGHAEEVVIGKWLRRFRPDLGVIRRGFMARSLEAPWLHATFDRFVVKGGRWVPVQMKTAHQFAGAGWADAVPAAVQAQVQAELFVHGSDHGYAVAFVGGRSFHVHRIDRDEAFVRDLLLPITGAFWREHVERREPPPPSTPAEAADLFPARGASLVADLEAVTLWEALGRAEADRDADDATVEALRLALMVRMQGAETLVDDAGRVLVTWRTRQGARRLDTAALRRDHPDIADAYTRRGEPTRQFSRKTITKEGANR